jgi:hypothetical protein
MTRYEFAVAIARMLDTVGGSTGTVIDDSKYVKYPDLDGYLKKSDLPNNGDVDALRKLLKEFQPELVTLGVDLDAARKRLDALDARVKALEADAQRIRISGDLNVYTQSNELKQKSTSTGLGTPRSNEFDRNSGKTSGFIDYNGFSVGSGVGHNKSFVADTYVTHDLDLNVKGRLTETANADVVINVGNYLNYLGSINQTIGARSTRPSYRAYPGQKVSLDEDITLYKAVVNANIGSLGLTVGRNPFQLTPYTLKQGDVDLYHDNVKTDSGNIPLDGITGTLKLGSVNLTGFAYKVDPIKYVSNVNDNFANQRTGGTQRYGVYAGARYGAYVNRSISMCCVCLWPSSIKR